MKPAIKPCPFCGWEVPYDDYESMLDILYRNGILWRYRPSGRVEFLSKLHTNKYDGYVWKLECNESMGGCGAEMHGLTEMEVTMKWNRRI